MLKALKLTGQEGGTPVPIPDSNKVWKVCFLLGGLFWVAALIIWWQAGIDQSVLFFFNDQRISYDPIIRISKWLSSSGMATITILFVIYLILSKFLKELDAPVTIYFYTICSFGLSGIAGDLLKQVFARPRPLAVFGNDLLILSTSASYALPSGHATKSIALVLPFLLLVGNQKAIHKTLKVIISLIGAGVCFSRVALGAHYLSDVLAGIGMALVGLPLSMMFARMVLRNAKQEQLPALSIVWGILLVFLTMVFMIL